MGSELKIIGTEAFQSQCSIKSFCGILDINREFFFQK